MVRREAVLLGLALVCLHAMGCGDATTDHHHATSAKIEPFDGTYPIKVVCTTGPVADMLARLGGKYFQITALMGPGIDPHSYKALPKDNRLLREADAVFYNGLHLEGRMGDIFASMARKKPTIAVTQGAVDDKDNRLREAPEFEGNFDPHVWHDPLLWTDCARFVATKLKQIDPSHADEFDKNLSDFTQSLKELDEECRARIETIPKKQRVLVTAHDAFEYFAKAYGMEVEPLQGLSTTAELSIGDIEAVADVIVQRGIKTVFVESAVSHQTIVALVEACVDRGHKVAASKRELYADALGKKGTDAETYEGMLRANVSTIVEGLK